jgi:hypothetical protein
MSQLLYHWTTASKATTALKKDKLMARKWQHYIEQEEQLLNGTSWSESPDRWRAENDVCLVMDPSLIDNKRYDIPGHRTYLQTQGMVNPIADPKAYLDESTKPDEAFIVGTIANFRASIVEIRTDNEAVANIARDFGIEVGPLPSSKLRSGPR